MVNLNDAIFMECNEYISNLEETNTSELLILFDDSNSLPEQRKTDNITKLKATYVYHTIKELRFLDNMWIYSLSSNDIYINSFGETIFKQICTKYPLPIQLKTFLFFKTFYDSIALYLPYERFKSISNAFNESNLSQSILYKYPSFENYVTLNPNHHPTKLVINSNQCTKIDTSSCISIIKQSNESTRLLKKRKVEFDLSSLDMKANKRRSCRNKTTVINIQNCFSTIQERLNYINKSYFQQLDDKNLPDSLLNYNNDKLISKHRTFCRYEL